MNQKQWTVMGTILLFALFAFIINQATGDASVWGYLLPIGVILGLVTAARIADRSDQKSGE